MRDELKLYIENNLDNDFEVTVSTTNKVQKSILKSFGSSLSRESFYQKEKYKEEAILSDESVDLKSWIQENNQYNDFQTMLFELIDDRNLVDADVYNKVHIDRRLFSKIRNDKNYHPSKETILLLGFSLELSETEIEKLLESASYSLPRNNHYDLIIRFCFMKGIYKIKDVNDLLDEYNCKLFNY